MRECPFFMDFMRHYYFSTFFTALLLFLLSCGSSSTSEQPVVDEASQTVLISDSLVADTLPKDTLHVIPSDSVRIVVEFFDAMGATLTIPTNFTVWDDYIPINLTSDENGSISYMTKNDHMVFVTYANDTLATYFNMNGGEMLNDHIQINVLPMYGRIMDNDGTPHQNMPVHVHYRLSKKDKSMACESDLVFHTDCKGYYRTYVSTSFHSIVLRSCGFAFGFIPKKEFSQYPKQNFLFNPYEVENRCSYYVPEHELFLCATLEDGTSKTIMAEKWENLFSEDAMLDNLEEISLLARFETKSYTYKLKKRNGAFRLPKLSVCFK